MLPKTKFLNKVPPIDIWNIVEGVFQNYIFEIQETI